MLKRLITSIEKMHITLREWLLALLSIALVRIYIENFSGRADTMVGSTDMLTLVHYILFYILVTTLLILTVHFFARVCIRTVSNVVLFGSLIIITPPITDLLISSGDGYVMAYIRDMTVSGLFNRYLTFFGAYTLPGITYGIRIEVAVVTLATIAYVYFHARSATRAIFSGVAAYTAIFFCVSFPSYFGIETSLRWLHGTKHTLFGQHFFHPESGFVTVQRTFEMYFGGAVSHGMLLLIIVLGCIIAWLWNKTKVIAVFKNSRPERILHYACAIIIGIVLAMREGVISTDFSSWLDSTTLAYLFIAFIAAWMFAVGVNDIVDVKSDTISNSNRPLVTGVLTIDDVRNANLVFFILMIVSGYLAGHYALFMVLSFTAIYYVYSVPPLHLKRFAIVNSFLIALATLAAVYAGFYTVSSDQTLGAFPKEWGFFIVLWYTLVANIKDIKDTVGDKAVGVYTLTVLLGHERGKKLIGAMVACALLTVPVMTEIVELWYPTVLGMIGAYYIIQREPFVERHLFYLYFMYLISLAVLLM